MQLAQSEDDWSGSLCSDSHFQNSEGTLAAQSAENPG
jgi:hypothetical protein